MNEKAENISETDNGCRAGLNPIPDNIYSILNESQKQTLVRMEGLGWTLKFVRRVGLSKPIVVLIDSSDQNFGVLEENGDLEEKPKLKIRKAPREDLPGNTTGEAPPEMSGDRPPCETNTPNQGPSVSTPGDMTLVPFSGIKQAPPTSEGLRHVASLIKNIIGG